MTPLEALATARWVAAHHAAYLSRVIFALSFVEAPPGAGLKTLGVDRFLRVYYCPAYIAQCQADGTLSGEIMHETLHIVLRHLTRGKVVGGDLEPHAWNCAGDCELDQRIEEIIAAGGSSGNFKPLRLVADRVGPAHFRAPRGLTAEEYFARRPKGQGGADGVKGACGGGSGTGAGAAAWELPQGAAGAPPGLTEGEVTLVLAQTAQDVLDAAATRGNVPAGVLRWAEGFFEAAPIDWAMLLSERVRYQLDVRKGTHPSYARPSRRRFGRLVLPTHRTPQARIAVVGDTSGSMDTKDIGHVIATVMSAVERLGSVFAIGCDAAATEPVEVRDAESLREALRGGGGTDMGIGIAKAEEADPDAIVVVTDGDTDWPAQPPEAPLIVALTRRTSFPLPAWAEVVWI